MNEQLGSPAVQEATIINVSGRRVAAGLLVATLGVGSLVACSSENTSNTGSATDTHVAFCGELTFSNAAADSTIYGSEAALPKQPTVHGPSEVAPYINSLFDKNGPLAGKGDAASLALIEAAVTEPAQDHKVFDPKRSIIGAFDSKASEYAGPNGLTTAKADCNASFDVLSQVAKYNNRWAAKGGQVLGYLALHRTGHGSGRHHNR